jgi:hypothetical protein
MPLLYRYCGFTSVVRWYPDADGIRVAHGGRQHGDATREDNRSPAAARAQVRLEPFIPPFALCLLNPPSARYWLLGKEGPSVRWPAHTDKLSTVDFDLTYSPAAVFSSTVVIKVGS